MPEYEREIGEMTVKIAMLEKAVTDMGKDLKAVRDTLAEAKGSWRTVLAVAGLSSALVALVIKMVPFVGTLPR